MVGIDLFAGAGGLALGATQAGINVIMAIESDYFACKTYEHNNRATKILGKDISIVKKKDLPKTNEKKILFGGPPCQGFSTSNQKNRTVNNTTNWLFKEFFRIVKFWCPSWIVFENVKGITETERGFFFSEIKNEFLKLGYTTSSWVLNAADFGVPQIRQRLFLIGSREGKKLNAPHKLIKKLVTVKEAISDLPNLQNGASVDIMPYKEIRPSNYAQSLRNGLNESSNHLVTKNGDCIIERYKHIPQGGNWENIPHNLMKNYRNKYICHTGIYRRLKLDQPSVVLGNYRKNMLIHPTQDRGLSVREAARLQSFPDWYVFHGSIGFQQQQVGNAVPPILAKVVFDEIINNE